MSTLTLNGLIPQVHVTNGGIAVRDPDKPWILQLWRSGSGFPGDCRPTVVDISPLEAELIAAGLPRLHSFNHVTQSDLRALRREMARWERER